MSDDDVHVVVVHIILHRFHVPQGTVYAVSGFL
jgi:hypothetical protein